MTTDVRFERLVRSHASLLAELATWPHESLVWQPSSDCWSVAQIVQHIARTESAILAEMETNVASPTHVSKSDRLKSSSVILLFSTSARVRVPGAAEAILPAANAGWSKARDEWEVSQRSLKLFAVAHESLASTAGIFRHPVGGWMGLATALKFLDVHIRHHRYQLNRLRAALNAHNHAPFRADG